MPEYLAPGVYVEEVSFRAKSIEGVSTSTTAFIGPARFGPLSGEPELLTSFNQFERIFGGLDQLAYALETDLQATPAAMTNYLAHAVRAFFANGGRRLYVARAFRSFADVNKARAAATPAQPALALPADQNGAAAATAALQVAIAAVGAAQEAADAVREAALIALQALVQGILPADVSPPMIDLEVASAADIKTALQKTANTLTDEKDTAQAALTAENNNIKTAAAAHDSAALQAALDRIQAKLPAGRT